MFETIQTDALLSSQINNRKLHTVGSSFSIHDSKGKINEDATTSLASGKWSRDLIQAILDTIFYGHTLVEIELDENKKPIIHTIPRTNVIPEKGIVLKDFTEDKGIQYKEMKEYGTWILEFGKPLELGLLNKAVPHVLFKRFANSCWSELCEIYGIPPRVLKTNTDDPAALNQAEKMMRDWGAAGWFIIDSTESLEFASAVNTKGEVYKELMEFSNNELSMLVSGAIVGQDTKNGSNSKEQSSQNLLHSLIQSDKVYVEQYMNSVVMPALARIGVIPNNLTFKFDKVVNTAELWERTVQILPYKNIDNEWLKTKFGIEITGDRQTNPLQNETSQNNSLTDADFFV